MPALTPAGNNPSFSLEAFRRFESVISRAIEAYPVPIVVNTAPIKAVTFNARLREAARGYFTYHHHSPTIHRDKFIELWPQINLIVESTFEIKIGASDVLKGYGFDPTTGTNTFTTSSSGDIIFDCPDITCFKSFLHLCDNSCFSSQPIKLRNTNLEIYNYVTSGQYQLDYPNTFADALSLSEIIIN